jgi:pSer/pThr/pTyr-binding forkhead associated (FHA) protein
MKLVVEDEAGTRSIVPFASDELVVGRGAEGVAWKLPDRNVSRRHARFVRANGVLWIEDLESLTGTRVNGERIQGRRRLREGDLVEIGDYDLAVLSDPAVTAGPSTPPPIRAGAPVSARDTSAAASLEGAAVATPVLDRAAPPEPSRAAPGDARRTPARASARPADRSRLAVTAVAAAASGLLGLAAGYLAGWLGLL